VETAPAELMRNASAEPISDCCKP